MSATEIALTTTFTFLSFCPQVDQNEPFQCATINNKIGLTLNPIIIFIIVQVRAACSRHSVGCHRNTLQTVEYKQNSHRSAVARLSAALFSLSFSFFLSLDRYYLSFIVVHNPPSLLFFFVYPFSISSTWNLIYRCWYYLLLICLPLSSILNESIPAMDKKNIVSYPIIFFSRPWSPDHLLAAHALSSGVHSGDCALASAHYSWCVESRRLFFLFMYVCVFVCMFGRLILSIGFSVTLPPIDPISRFLSSTSIVIITFSFFFAFFLVCF